jgi:hypothetical protein
LCISNFHNAVLAQKGRKAPQTILCGVAPYKTALRGSAVLFFLLKTKKSGDLHVSNWL